MKLSESVRSPVRSTSDPLATIGKNTSNGDAKRAKTVNFKTAARVVQLAGTTPAGAVDDDVFNDPTKQLNNRKRFQESVNHQFQESEKSETPGKTRAIQAAAHRLFIISEAFSFFFSLKRALT